MYTAPEMFRAVIGRIEQFYLRANEIFFEATRGKLHAILIGNDFGGQRGLMLAPEKIREFAFPGTRHFIQQAKSYGVKVIHHSCGGIRDIIPDLIEMGADAINPIQALAAGMEPKGLKRDFGDQVAFCGGVDAQNLMVNGTPEQVRQKVRELKKIFPTGLIFSPSHETILFDTPPANVEAMFQAIQEKYKDENISEFYGGFWLSLPAWQPLNPSRNSGSRGNITAGRGMRNISSCWIFPGGCSIRTRNCRILRCFTNRSGMVLS